MSDDSAGPKAEIVIIRRRAADDGAAVKGGAWKIAYADFVTAMMAFFLVMWLINASNEATRSQVASYFNPIKLTDSSTGDKGIVNPKKTSQKKADHTAQEVSAESTTQEEKLLTDPQKTLEEIMAEVGSQQASAAGGESGGGATKPVAMEPLPGVGDPFDPKSWEAVPKVSAPVPEVKSVADLQVTDDPKESVLPEVVPRIELHVPPAIAQQAKPEVDHAPTESAASENAAMIERQIYEKLGKLPAEVMPGLQVTAVNQGILISLTDKHTFGMFQTGSAEPEAELVEMIGAVAEVLKDQNGFVVLRGHTDSRPYRNKKYDNWQLSTSRAHMAHYMLVRGGLDESRIHRIEGVADREPLLPEEPEAAENRRIEILLGQDP